MTDVIPFDSSEDCLLKLPAVLKIFPVYKSYCYQGIAEGRYPAPIKLSPVAFAWRKSGIDALVNSLQASKS